MTQSASETKLEADIVEEMRSRAIVGDDRDPHWRAADEIERLRALREGIEAAVTKAYHKGVHDGLKHGPIVTTWCYPPSEAAALHPSVAEGRRGEKDATDD